MCVFVPCVSHLDHVFDATVHVSLYNGLDPDKRLHLRNHQNFTSRGTYNIKASHVCRRRVKALHCSVYSDTEVQRTHDTRETILQPNFRDLILLNRAAASISRIVT